VSKRSEQRGTAIGILLLIGLAIHFWQYVLTVALIIVAVKVGRRLYRQYQAAVAAKAASDAALCARADAEYNAMSRGDLAQGMYGQYQPPEELK
jgi:hypothetical protein